MEPIQAIAIVLAIFFLSRVFLRYRDNKVNVRELLLWSVVWLAVISVALVPGVTSFISKFFGVGRPIDLLVYLSIIVLFYLIFRVYIKLEGMRENITELTRKVAIEEADEE